MNNVSYSLNQQKACDASQEAWMDGNDLYYFVTKFVILDISIALNLTILICVICSKRLRTTPNVLIASLATGDLLYAIINNVHAVVIFQGVSTGQWPVFCGVFGTMLEFLFLFTLTSNYINVFLISLERWLYIIHPFVHQRLDKPTYTACLIVGVWIFGFTINIDLVIPTNSLIPPNVHIRISIVLPCLHLIWSIVLCGIYAHIAVVTLRHRRAIKLCTGRASNVAGRSQEFPEHKTISVRESWKISRMLVVTFGTFFVLLTPLTCYNIYKHSHVPEEAADSATKLIGCAHYCATFFVYAMQHKEFKRVLRTCCRRLRYLRRRSQVEPMELPDRRKDTNISLVSTAKHRQ